MKKWPLVSCDIFELYRSSILIYRIQLLICLLKSIHFYFIIQKLTKGPERPMVDPYLPPVAGILWWIHKLRKRIQNPMEDFIIFEDPCVPQFFQ